MSDTDVSLYVTSLAGGGAHKMMVNIAKGLNDLGYTVDIVLVKKEGPFIKNVPDEINIVDLNSARTLLSIPQFINYLNKNNPKALLVTPVAPTVPAIWAAYLSKSNVKIVLRIPVVLTEAEFYSDPNGIKDLALSRLTRLFYPYADNYVAISQGVANDMIKNFGIDQSQIEVIYNPAIDDQISSKSQISVSHPFFDESVPVLIGVGRLAKQKDFPTLIRAFDQFLSEEDARLIILGEGPQRKKLEALVKDRGLSNKVSFPGFVENPFSYMRKADVFVLSSAWEGFGNVIPEALMCGTPVVSTDCKSGPREILKDGKYGRLVEVGNEEQMCQAVFDTLEKPIASKELKKRAEDFHINSIVPQYAELLFR